LVSSQPADRRDRLQLAFRTLMQSVTPTLETRNRETFTQNLTGFRAEIKQFIVL
jgi:exportin-7